MKAWKGRPMNYFWVMSESNVSYNLRLFLRKNVMRFVRSSGPVLNHMFLSHAQRMRSLESRTGRCSVLENWCQKSRCFVILMPSCILSLHRTGEHVALWACSRIITFIGGLWSIILYFRKACLPIKCLQMNCWIMTEAASSKF